MCERALALHPDAARGPLHALRRLGGGEIAVLCGLALGAGEHGLGYVCDGLIATAAAAVAAGIEPDLRPRLLAGHRSPEPAHGVLLDHLGLEPVLDLGLRLGEGSGATAALAVLRPRAGGARRHGHLRRGRRERRRMSPLAARPASRAPSPRAAVAFLTRLPVGGGALTAATALARGAVVPGRGPAGRRRHGRRARAGRDRARCPTPATALALLAAMLVTGALHEDGLADAADAIGAHVPRERRLEILRDSRVGTYGALALVFAVLFPLVVLTPLDDGDFLRAALVGHVVGRWSILPQSLLLPPARARRRGRADARRAATTTPWRRAYTVAIALVAGRPAAGAVALGVGALLTVAGRAGLPPHARRRDGRHLRGADQGRRAGCYAALVAMWA